MDRSAGYPRVGPRCGSGPAPLEHVRPKVDVVRLGDRRRRAVRSPVHDPRSPMGRQRRRPRRSRRPRGRRSCPHQRRAPCRLRVARRVRRSRAVRFSRPLAARRPAAPQRGRDARAAGREPVHDVSGARTPLSDRRARAEHRGHAPRPHRAPEGDAGTWGGTRRSTTRLPARATRAGAAAGSALPELASGPADSMLRRWSARRYRPQRCQGASSATRRSFAVRGALRRVDRLAGGRRARATRARPPWARGRACSAAAPARGTGRRSGRRRRSPRNP